MLAQPLHKKLKYLTLMGWWYFCLGTGFLLMGLYRLIIGERLWLVLLRWLLAVGFLALAFTEAQSKDSRDKGKKPGDNLF